MRLIPSAEPTAGIHCDTSGNTNELPAPVTFESAVVLEAGLAAEASTPAATAEIARIPSAPSFQRLTCLVIMTLLDKVTVISTVSMPSATYRVGMHVVTNW